MHRWCKQRSDPNEGFKSPTKMKGYARVDAPTLVDERGPSAQYVPVFGLMS